MKRIQSMIRVAGFAACTLAAISLAAAQQNQPNSRDNDQQPQPRTNNAQNDDRNDQNNQRDDTNQTEQNGQARVQLGVRIAESPTTGVRVTDVAPGGTAQRAGIRQGDYILSMDGKTISSPQDFQQLMSSAEPGKQAKIVIWRNQARQTLTATFPQSHTTGFRGTQGNQQAQPWLGVQVADARGKQAQGARVVAVYPSGPASFAGLQPGDHITRIADKNIQSPNDVTSAIRGMKPDQEVKIMVMRGGEQQTLTATLGNRFEYFPRGASSPPRNGQQTASGHGDFQSSGIPAHAMMLEQHRRFAQQHQRIEKLVLDLKKEVEELRAELRANGRIPNRATPNRSTEKPDARPLPNRERDERDSRKESKPKPDQE